MAMPPPRVDARRPLRLPPFEARRMGNGLRVYAARVARLPIIRMDLLMSAGAMHDVVGKAGLATLVASLLDEGPPGSTATEIAEQLGGSLHTGATWDTAGANVTLLAEHLAEGVRLLARVVLNPTFPDREVERRCDERLATLRQQRRAADRLAERALAWAIYGPTPYGWPLYGNLQTVGSLTRSDFVNFYDRHCGITGMALVAAGDFEVEELCDRVEAVFATASIRAAADIDVRAPLRQARSTHLVDLGHAPQVRLCLGHAGPPCSHPQFTIATMVNSILGGRFTSRMNLRLREHLGHTYGAQSQFVARRGPGPFEVSTAIPASATAAAVTAILEEIERIQRWPVSRGELDETREYLRGTLARHLQTVEGVVNVLSMFPVFGLGDDHFDHYLQTIARATDADLLEGAQKFLDPEHLAIVAVGAASALVSSLEPFGHIEVWNPLADSVHWL